MIKKIALILLVSGLAFIGIQIFGAYRLYQRSTFRFLKFDDLLQIFEGNRQITMRISNPTNRTLLINNLNLQLEDGANIRMGGFQPINLSIKQGENDVLLTFTNDTRYIKIGTDYVTGAIRNYNVLVTGLWLGFIPIRFRVKLSNLI